MTTAVVAEKAALYQELATGALGELQRLERASGLAESATAAATAAELVRAQSSEAANRAAAVDAALSSHEATFAKIPAYVEKLRQIRANLVVLAHNAQKVRFLATEVARECGVPITDALAAAAKSSGSSKAADDVVVVGSEDRSLDRPDGEAATHSEDAATMSAPTA
jgi:hypothetical protein